MDNPWTVVRQSVTRLFSVLKSCHTAVPCPVTQLFPVLKSPVTQLFPVSWHHLSHSCSLSCHTAVPYPEIICHTAVPCIMTSSVTQLFPVLSHSCFLSWKHLSPRCFLYYDIICHHCSLKSSVRQLFPVPKSFVTQLFLFWHHSHSPPCVLTFYLRHISYLCPDIICHIALPCVLTSYVTQLLPVFGHHLLHVLNNNVPFYVLFLQTGARSPLLSKEPKHSQNRLVLVHVCTHMLWCSSQLQHWVVWILWDPGELCWSDSYSPAPIWTSTQQTESAENRTVHVWIFWPAGRCLKLVMLGDIRLHFDSKSNSDHNVKSLKSLFPTLHLAHHIIIIIIYFI